MVLCKIKETVDDLCLGMLAVGKPLDIVRRTAVKINASDQVYLVVVAGKSGGLDIKKQQIFAISQAGERIGFFKNKFVFYGDHGASKDKNQRWCSQKII